MKKSAASILVMAILPFIYATESKVAIVGDTVIAKDEMLSSSQGNLEVEGSLTVGKGAVQIASNGDVIITGKVILKNPDGGISMGEFGRPEVKSEAKE